MLFNSIHFVFFFPIVVAIYFAFPHRFRWALLLVASYYFYMCWEPTYAILIFASTVIDYVAAIQIGRASSATRRRLFLLFSLFGNFGILFAFKYFNFVSGSIETFLGLYGVSHSFMKLNVLLPIGISFYTFQSVSYTIDVYRGKQKPERHLGIFALYVSFFPQLVAGPIERANHLLPQFFEKHTYDPARVRDGLLLMGAGFFKKLVIADRLGIYVNEVYANPTEYGGLPFVIAAYGFTFQVFTDFSGYSDIAIGAAQVMGYELNENFRRPYYAKSMAEFWRRWHISLSTWFRDYIYFPLGGNRVSTMRHYRNVFIVFMVSGLWHGAAWTFVIWGALHGLYLIVGDVTKGIRERIVRVLFPPGFEGLHRLVQVIIVFHLFGVALILFRAHSVPDAYILVSSTLKNFSLDDPAVFKPLSAGGLVLAALGIAAMETVHLIQRGTPVRARLATMPLPVRWTAYLALGFGILLCGSFTSEEFVYFQF